MGITDRQREQRKHNIGASDIPAILGISPWRSAWDVAAEKRGLIESPAENEAMKRGNYLETAILDYAQDQIGEPLIRNQRRVCPELHLAASCDALVKSTGIPVEAKSSRAIGLYGDGESDVPLPVRAQCHGQMLCTETDYVWVPVLVASLEFRLYRVPRNDRLVDLLTRVLPAWWHECVELDQAPTEELYRKLGLPNVNPLALCPSLDVACSIVREEGKTIDLPADARSEVDEYEALGAKIKELETERESHQRRIYTMMGDAMLGKCGDRAVKIIAPQDKWVEPKAGYMRHITPYFRIVNNKESKGE